MTVTEHSLGFPVNRTYYASISKTDETQTLDELLGMLLADRTSQNVKIILSCTREEKKSWKTTDIESALTRNPNIKNVAVVYDIQKELHVRSEKITKAKTAAEKLDEYLRVNKMNGTEELSRIATEIEDNLAVSYTAPCHSFTLLWLKLKGSTGIKEGTGKDEYTLNLTQFSSGVIALSAVCGRGKSTLIENCQPWLRMLTRNGKLQDHFFLKDSCRELMYQDEEGTFYHITIMIDGKNKSGKVKAFAEIGKDISRMEPVTECDGNLDPYEKWVEDTFGSIDLFLRTAFYTKGNTNGVPDISTATKGEKRTLFNSLMGMDKLVAISQIAREKAKEIKAEIEKLEAMISDIDYDNALTDNSEAMDACKRHIKSLSEQSDKIKFTLDEIKRQIIPCGEKENELRELETKLASLISEIQSCNRKLETVEKWNCISGIYSEWEKLNTDLSALNSTIDSVTKEIMEKSNRRAEYDRKKEEAFKTFTKSELEYEKFKAAVPEKNDDICPTCGQKLPVGKIKELEERLSRQKKELSELEKHMKEKESVLISATKAVNSYTEEHIKPLEGRRENLIALQSELKERIEKTGITDSDTALKAKAETYLEDKVFDRKNALESERDNIAGRISKLKEEIASIDNSMHEARIRSLEEELSNTDTLLSSAKEDLGGLKKERDILERNRKIEERTRAELKEKQHLQSNYEIVEKAFGANGIQALEMEAVAPDVAEVTNSILQSAYGDKFKVSFQTLRLGSKKELIEDFSIMVENTETGSVKPLEWLSGGEGTWIKEALFHAFSVVRMRNTKFSFRTNFLDEADGALDHDSKLRYLKMIEKAHIESGVDKTILITHSQELKDVIEQKIEL